ncbi:unnamed protein product [Cyprideis torosa]|uniref:Uncharacterized protein n=1 Tax=Cyprideis torosa TaxID=163714 RepID=A0A7R8WJ61_9CRUS|nr:unnamed protein product [Cyprideis torosa]CAG0901624.1 unnamed protein product [Cyprideis torosa]
MFREGLFLEPCTAEVYQMRWSRLRLTSRPSSPTGRTWRETTTTAIPTVSSPEKEILWASQEGKVEDIARLLEADPKLVDVRDQDGYTPLHRACYGSHDEVVELLLKYDAPVDAQTIDGWTPLHSAALWGADKCMAMLLNAPRINVNAQSNGGQTPLHVACSSGHTSRVALIQLLSHPWIQPDLKNQQGETAYEVAERHTPYAYLFQMADKAVNQI